MAKRLSFVVAAAAVATCLSVPTFAGIAWAAPKTGAPAGNTIGIAPAGITFSSALRSGVYQTTVTIINGSPVAKWYTVTATGQLASWLSIVDTSDNNKVLSKVLVPPGAEGQYVTLQAKVPPTAANGTYTGALDLRLVGGPGKGDVSALVGVQAKVNLTVTGTEVVGGSVIEVYTYPKVEVGSAVPVYARVKNTSNITVQPQFDLRIVKSHGNAVVYHWRGTTGEGLLPNHVSTYELDWPGRSTLSQTLGAYSAHLTVNFPAGKHLGSWHLPFNLFPYGSLHRGGSLLSLALANRPLAGGQADVQASVVSTGEIQQETSFVGQLYRNGSLVGEVKSPVPVLLSPKGQAGAAGTVTVPFGVPKNGMYRLTGVANFAGAQTKPATLTFRVGPKPVPVWYKIGGAALIVVVLIAAVATWRRRRRRPPALPVRPHVQPRYTATHGRTLHVPPRAPVGTTPGRTSSRSRRA